MRWTDEPPQDRMVISPPIGSCPEKKMCPDCGGIYYNAGHHAEACYGKLDGSPFRPCGRSFLMFGGRVKATCWRISGHDGECQ